MMGFSPFTMMGCSPCTECPFMTLSALCACGNSNHAPLMPPFAASYPLPFTTSPVQHAMYYHSGPARSNTVRAASTMILCSTSCILVFTSSSESCCRMGTSSTMIGSPRSTCAITSCTMTPVVLSRSSPRWKASYARSMASMPSNCPGSAGWRLIHGTWEPSTLRNVGETMCMNPARTMRCGLCASSM